LQAALSPPKGQHSITQFTSQVETFPERNKVKPLEVTGWDKLGREKTLECIVEGIAGGTGLIAGSSCVII